MKQQLLTILANFSWKVCFVVSFALGVMYWMLLFNDGSAKALTLKSVQDQKRQADASLKATIKAVENADKFEKEVKTLSDQFSKIVEIMPEKLTMVDLATMLTDLSIKTGVTLIKTEPKSDIGKGEFYDSIRIGFQAEGTFEQIVSFLSQLSRVPRIMTMESVILENKTDLVEETPKLNFEAVVIGYRYIREADPKDAPKTDAAPGAAPAPPASVPPRPQSRVEEIKRRSLARGLPILWLLLGGASTLDQAQAQAQRPGVNPTPPPPPPPAAAAAAKNPAAPPAAQGARPSAAPSAQIPPGGVGAPAPPGVGAPAPPGVGAPGGTVGAGTGLNSMPVNPNDPNVQVSGENSILSLLMEPFDYDPRGRRDPFGQPLGDKPLAQGNVHGPLVGLEKFELNALRISGILWNVKDPKAMVKDPQGNIYVVTPGARIGPHNGYVASIREGELVIVETSEIEGHLVSIAQVMRLGQ